MLIVLAVFSIIVVTFYTLFSGGTKYILESKKRLKAAAVANERMEMIRSLEFNQIGIVGSGYISGDIPSFSQTTVDNNTFFIFSSVVYVDDSYDGIEDGTPDDDRPNDYKRVTVKVAWENDFNTSRAVSFSSDFAPPGVEADIGGGTLMVKILNKDSENISQFNVHIENDDLNISEDLITDSNGGVSLPGIPADGNDYEISISKSDYFSINTLPAYPTSVFYPIYAHASVTEGNKNIYSITTDLLSDLTLSTKDPFGNIVQNIGYNLKGGIKKGDTVDDPPDNPTAPVFYYDENLNSGSNGEDEMNDISYGDYTFSFTDAVSDYEFIKISPYNALLNNKAKFSVEPGADIEETAIFADKNINSLLAEIVDSATSLPVKDASIRLYNLTLPTPYDATLSTDDFGLAYFPISLPELEAEEYNITIQSDGYANKNDLVNINDYTKKQIEINPN